MLNTLYCGLIIIGVLIISYPFTPYFKKNEAYKVTHCENCGEHIIFNGVKNFENVHCPKCGTHKNLHKFKSVLIEVKRCSMCNSIKSRNDEFCQCGEKLRGPYTIVEDMKLLRVINVRKDYFSFGAMLIFASCIMIYFTS